MANDIANKVLQFSQDAARREIKDWSSADWESFTAGWQRQRLGNPAMGSYRPSFFRAGQASADFHAELVKSQSS